MPNKTREPTPVRRILNCLPSPSQETDWTFGAAMLAGVAAPDFPEAKDLREGWWKVGDQGSTGSCVGWAAADSVLRWHFVKAGRIQRQDRLSTRFTWMASKELDEFISAPTTFIEQEGTSLKAALDVSRRYGAVLEADLPFAGGALSQANGPVFYAKAARLKIASYINLEPSLTSWRRWLANNGPILTRLDVDETWDQVDAQGRLALYRPETARGGHAVALVGYDAEGFIVRNSWGAGWGSNGFAHASDAYAAAAFSEAYGVTLGGAPVMAGVSDDTITAHAAAKTAVVGEWTIEQIELLVKRTAERVGRQPVFLGQTVGEVFTDGLGLDRLLAEIQTTLGVGALLSAALRGDGPKLLKGSFLALADWILRKLKAGAV